MILLRIKNYKDIETTLKQTNPELIPNLKSTAHQFKLTHFLINALFTIITLFHGFLGIIKPETIANINTKVMSLLIVISIFIFIVFKILNICLLVRSILKIKKKKLIDGLNNNEENDKDTKTLLKNLDLNIETNGVYTAAIIAINMSINFYINIVM